MPTSGDVIRAVAETWAAAATLKYLGGPYRDQAPPGPTAPYVIVRSTLNGLDRATNTSEYWRHVLEFHVYDTTIEAIDGPDGHLEKIGAVFDGVIPTMAAGRGRIIRSRRKAEEGKLEDQGIYRGALTYEFLRSKPRTR